LQAPYKSAFEDYGYRVPLYTLWQDLFGHKKPSAIYPDVTPQEALARFLFSGPLTPRRTNIANLNYSAYRVTHPHG